MSWFGESTRHAQAARKKNSFTSIVSRRVSHKQKKAFFVREMKKELAKTNPDEGAVTFYRTQARIESRYYKGRV